MMENVKVAAIQFDIKSGDKEGNLSKAVKMLNTAAKEGVQIAALPDFLLMGIPVTKDAAVKTAEPIPGPATDRLAEVAERHKMYVVAGGIVEKERGKLYLTCPVIGPDGHMIGKYRQVNLCRSAPYYDEVGAGLSPGTDHPVFKTDIGTIGTLIGYDIDYPEPARVLALRGAEIIFFMTGLGYVWKARVGYMQQAYAFLNEVYWVSANRTGIVNSNVFFGESCVINPFGELVATAGQTWGTVGLNTESMAIATLDLELLRKLKARSEQFKRMKAITGKLLAAELQK
jgi:predicted amidohydrolase